MMKNFLLGILLVITILGYSFSFANDDSCREGVMTQPLVTYATGIHYGCDSISIPGEDIPIITISDSSGAEITIKALNEGATIPGLTSESFGYHYQYWNDFGFSHNQVDLTGVQVDNIADPYNSGIFVYGNRNWSTVDNGNLRQNNGKQGPCETGYYVPSIFDWQNLFKTYTENLGLDGKFLSLQNVTLTDLGKNFSEDMLFPTLLTHRSFKDGNIDTGDTGRYRSISTWGSSDSAYSVHINSNHIGINYKNARANGLAIRCFKKDYITVIFNAGEGGNIVGETEIKVKIGDGSSVEFPQLIINDGYILTGWYSGDVKIVNTESYVPKQNVTLIANYSLKEYNIDYKLNNGIILGSIENVTGYTVESNDISIISPIKTGYVFLGWSGTDIDGLIENIFIPKGSTGDRTYEANREAIEYTITYELDGGTNSENNIGKYTIETPDIILENPIKNGYTFEGWFSDAEFTTGVTAIPTGITGDITLYAKFTKIESKPSGGSSGGGGRSNKTSNTKDSQPSEQALAMLQNDNDTENVIQSETKGGEESSNTSMDSSNKSSEGQAYTQEFQQAYNFAHEKGITTMDTIDKANMNGKLTRIAMAKMLSYYAINVLGQKPDETRINKFKDIPDKLDAQYDSGVILAYQLGIMGINMPDNRFRPNDEVTRAEFATALSRMLYSTPDGKPYYSTHLAKLKAEGILTNDDYKMKELRGYVMIMLMRSAK